MAAKCSICVHPKLPEINARLELESGHKVAQTFDLSVASVYRHVRNGHHAPQKPAIGPNTSGLDPRLTAQVSKSLRQAEGLMRLAWKHLKATAVGSDPKATNGAIASANRTLELISELRGDLQRGAKVQVAISQDMRVAVDSHAQAESLAPHDVTEQARAYLAAQLEAGDAEAIRAVLALVRMVPGADASSEATG